MKVTVDINKKDNSNTKCKKWVYILFYILVFLSVFIIAYLFTCLGFYLTYPFPERTDANFMTPIMKEHMMHVTIALYLLILLFIFPLIFVMQICSIFLVRDILGKKISKKYVLNYDEPKRVKAMWIIVAVLFVALPPFFIWFMFYPLYKFEKVQVDEAALHRVRRYKRTKNGFTWAALISFTFMALSPAYLFGFLNERNKWVNKVTPQRKDELKDAYTLSKDNPNTIILYFDRLHGAYWNQLLFLDYVIFNKNSKYLEKGNAEGYEYLGDTLFPNEKPEDVKKFKGSSFIELYPEFTNYYNFLSNASVTNLSNPGISGSWFFDSKLRQSDLMNPVMNKNYNKTTNDEFLLNSYKFNLDTYEKYDRLSILSNPYYGTPDWHWSSNSTELEKDLNKVVANAKDKKIKVFNRNEIVKAYDGHILVDQPDDAFNFQRFGAHENTLYNELKNGKTQFDIITPLITKKDGIGGNKPVKINNLNIDANLSVGDGNGTMMYFHSNFTHEVYTSVTNKSLENKNNPTGLNYMNPSLGESVAMGRHPELQLDSMWFLMQKLKDLLFYLKNLPYTGIDSNINNQYDNTSIYILSDHGSNYLMGPRPKLDRMMDFLFNDLKLKGKDAELKEAKESWKKFSDGINIFQDIAFYNAVFMRKERKNPNSKQSSTSPWDILNTDLLLSLNDVMPIIESDYQKNNGKTSTRIDKYASELKEKNKKFLEKSNLNTDEKRLKNLIQNNVVADPLNPVNKYKINSRWMNLVYGEYFYYPDDFKNNILNIFSYNESKDKIYSKKYEESIYNYKRFTKF